MAAPIIPKAAPAPKAEAPVYAYTAPVEEKPIVEENVVEDVQKEEKTIFIPNPAQIEDIELKDDDTLTEEKDEPKKAGLFGRIFGRK